MLQEEHERANGPQVLGEARTDTRNHEFVRSLPFTCNAANETRCGRKSRSYIVERFHPEQKRLSMLWFRRYYLWHTMRDIVDDDKKDNQPYHTPIQHRTIDWFIEQYRRRSSEQESARAPRHMPRYLDDTDLRGMFADHCEWLLGTQIATFSSTIQLFNTSNWVDFCKKVQWSRRESAQDQSRGTKRIWGVARGSSLEDFSKDDPFGLERFGGTKEEWRKKLRDALNREAKALVSLTCIVNSIGADLFQGKAKGPNSETSVQRPEDSTEFEANPSGND